MKLQEKYNWLERTIKTSIQQGTCSKDLNTSGWLQIPWTLILHQRADLIKGKNTNDSRKQIAKLSKDMKTSLRKDKIQRRMETIERHSLQSRGIKKAYKELTNQTKDSITPILSEIFNNIINTETILQQYTQFNIILLYKKVISAISEIIGP